MHTHRTVLDLHRDKILSVCDTSLNWDVKELSLEKLEFTWLLDSEFFYTNCSASHERTKLFF